VKKFEYINHTADVEFKAYGKDLKELFRNSFIALFRIISTMDNAEKQKRVRRIKISERADTLENLMWYSLQDAISLGDAESLFFYNVGLVELVADKGYTLNAEIIGTAQKPKRLGFDIKAVSQYGIKIKKRGGVYSCNVIVDV
jgi:SHS2 domain-containing protein